MLNKTYLVDETPGSISNIYEIKILICQILNKLKTKITKNQLTAALQQNETVNYFNFCQALKELIESKHIIEIENEEKKILFLTDLGKETANLLTDNISNNIITKNLEIVKNFLKKESQNRDKKIYIIKKDGKYTVKLILDETKNTLLNLEFFCPNAKIAEKVEQRMKEHTIEIYESILAILENDKKTFLKIAEKLFF